MAICDLSSVMSLMECLEIADDDIFPNIRTLLMIGCILLVSSCEAERSFSCLRRVKTCLRNRMGEGRLSGLILMQMNHSMVIDTQTICEMFIQRNNRDVFKMHIVCLAIVAYRYGCRFKARSHRHRETSNEKRENYRQLTDFISWNEKN